MVDKNDKPYWFRMHVSGENDYSYHIIESVMEVLNEKIPNLYDFQVNNVLFKPKIAKEDNVKLTPALVKLKPEPKEVYTGIFHRIEKIRAGLTFLDKPLQPPANQPPAK